MATPFRVTPLNVWVSRSVKSAAVAPRSVSQVMLFAAQVHDTAGSSVVAESHVFPPKATPVLTRLA